ncbi:hypothetical protein NOR51B_150 [Luminiphilus syltensis NOR5-1B]|uniref:Uncharacterized protein n=1 Tax=Luminiphilus syltensis NOR5-1B TaxID=565045 RepID=B8KTC3_9GAMM|nr:hypothetical protein [Luminiphilus syltensis]EED34213.1 hypothetical protein NOR51B_150 [Luminiphilus syltensis NOR5-1B]
MGFFPHWISEDLSKISEEISFDSATYFDDLVRQIDKYDAFLEEAPQDAEIAELYEITPQGLSGFSRDFVEGLLHANEFLISRWVCQHQMKALCFWRGMKDAVSIANWLVAAACLRSFFEEVASFNYHLQKVTPLTKETSSLLQSMGKSVSKKNKLHKGWSEKFIKTQVSNLEKLSTSLHGGADEWVRYVKQKRNPSRLQSESAGPQFSPTVHINDCIRSLKKTGWQDAMEVYSLLSELVHPNFGASTLVVASRKRLNEKCGDVILSTRPKNREAATWFLELAIQPLASVTRVSAANIQLANSQMSFYQKNAEKWASLNTMLAGPSAQSGMRPH